MISRAYQAVGEKGISQGLLHHDGGLGLDGTSFGMSCITHTAVLQLHLLQELHFRSFPSLGFGDRWGRGYRFIVDSSSVYLSGPIYLPYPARRFNQVAMRGLACWWGVGYVRVWNPPDIRYKTSKKAGVSRDIVSETYFRTMRYLCGEQKKQEGSQLARIVNDRTMTPFEDTPVSRMKHDASRK